MTPWKRNTRIAIWTLALAAAGAFLSLKGAEPLNSKLLALLTSTCVGGLIGFGFGHTFAEPTSVLQRKLKIAYSVATFGIIGAVLGSADPGIRPLLRGILGGILVGSVVGVAVYFTSKAPADHANSSQRLLDCFACLTD
jgi:hypothetical protein